MGPPIYNRNYTPPTKSDIISSVAWVALVICFTIGGILLIIRHNEQRDNRHEEYVSRLQKARNSAAFSVSDIVYVRLTGQKGMVIKLNCFSRGFCEYDVRLSFPEITTNTRLFRTDDSVDMRPLSIVTMQEYELEKYHETH